jgi:hypothetical protein
VDEPAVFSRWYETLRFLGEIAPRLPKVHRPTLVARLLDHALALMEVVTSLRYTKQRGPLFLDADRHLDQIRVLARLMCDLRVLSVKQYERLALGVDEVGRMLGGWRRVS